jgi:hypothetical protein
VAHLRQSISGDRPLLIRVSGVASHLVDIHSTFLRRGPLRAHLTLTIRLLNRANPCDRLPILAGNQPCRVGGGSTTRIAIAQRRGVRTEAHRTRRITMANRRADDEQPIEGGGGAGSKTDARDRKGQTSGQKSTGARKSANRAGASGTGPKKDTPGSSNRHSGSRSGAGEGSKGEQD